MLESGNWRMTKVFRGHALSVLEDAERALIDDGAGLGNRLAAGERERGENEEQGGDKSPADHV